MRSYLIRSQWWLILCLLLGLRCCIWRGLCVSMCMSISVSVCLFVGCDQHKNDWTNRDAVWGGGVDFGGSNEPCIIWVQKDRMNPFAMASGDKLAMWPFAKLLWALVCNVYSLWFLVIASYFQLLRIPGCIEGWWKMDHFCDWTLL